MARKPEVAEVTAVVEPEVVVIAEAEIEAGERQRNPYTVANTLEGIKRAIWNAPTDTTITITVSSK